MPIPTRDENLPTYLQGLSDIPNITAMTPEVDRKLVIGKLADQEEKQKEASLSDKLGQYRDVWSENTVIGQEFNVQPTRVNPLDFFPEDNYKPISGEMAVKLTKDVGAPLSLARNLTNARSQAEADAYLNEAKADSKKRDMRNDILTNKEQMYGGALLSIADFDTLFSLAVSGGVGTIAKTLTTAERISGVATASALLSASHPFIMNTVKGENADTSEMLSEGIIRGFVEGLATKFMTPIYKDTIGKEVIDATKAPLQLAYNPQLAPDAQKLLGAPEVVNTVNKFGGAIESKVLDEFGTASINDIAKLTGGDGAYAQVLKEELTNKINQFGELAVKDKEFMQHMNNKDYESALNRLDKKSAEWKAPSTAPEPEIPRPETFSETVNKVVDLVESELVATTKTQFGAELHTYTNASKSFTETIDGIKTYLRENSFDLEKVGKAINAIKEDVSSTLKTVKELTGLSNKDKKLFEEVFNSDLDDLLNLAKHQDALLNKQTLSFEKSDVVGRTKNLMERMRANKDLFLEYASSTTKAELAKIENKITKLEKTIANLKEIKQTKAVIKDTAIAEKEVASLKTTVSSTTEAEIAKIEKTVLEKNRKSIRLVKDGDNYVFGKYKIPVAVAIATLGTTGAFASDGKNGMGGGDILVYGAIGAFTLFSLWKAQGIVRGASGGVISSIGERMFKGASENSGALEKGIKATQNFKQAIKDDALFLRTRFTETYAPLKKYALAKGDAKLSKFIDDILFDGLNGKTGNVEAVKLTQINKNIGRYTATERDLFWEWAKENKISYPQYVKSILDGTDYRAIFREYVTDVRDGLRSVDDLAGGRTIKAMAQESKRFREELIDMAEELGVDGVEKMKKLRNYVERRYKDNFRQLLTDTDEAGYNTIKQAFKDMYLGGLSKTEKAIRTTNLSIKNLLSHAGEDATSIKNFITENKEKILLDLDGHEELTSIIERMEKTDSVVTMRTLHKKFEEGVATLRNDEVVDSKISKYLEDLKSDGYANKVADVVSPLKHRIPLDLSKFNPNGLGIKILGSNKTIMLRDLFERNDFELFSHYQSSLSGHIALKQAGYTVSDAKKIIEKVGGQEKDELQNVLDGIVGVPIYTMTPSSTKFIQAMTNIGTSTIMAGGSALSVLQELTMVLGRMARYSNERGAVFRSIGDIVHDVVKNTGRESALSNILADMSGIGQSSKSGTAHFRGEAYGALDADINGGYLYNSTKLLRDTVLTGRGVSIGRWADMNEKLNLVMNLERLNDIVLNDRVYGKFLMDKYGITAEDRMFLKNHLSYNAKGHAKLPTYNLMSTSEKLKFQSIMFNMNQYGAQISTIGSTPNIMYATSVGNMFGKLIAYPINSVSNIALPTLKGMFNGDADAYTTMALSYMGAYASAKARVAIMGRKDKTEEQYHMYALLNSPFLAPMAIEQAITSPAVPSGITKLAHIFGSGGFGH